MVFEASVQTVHVWAHGLSCETPVTFAKCQEQFYNCFFCPHKIMTNCCKFCLHPEKSLEHNRNSTGTLPPSPPSGPTPLGPHFFWVVVCAVCAAPDSAACCSYSCCLCSCCGLLLPLFLLLLVLVAAFGPPTVELTSLPPLQCLTLQNVNNNFSQLIGAL